MQVYDFTELIRYIGEFTVFVIGDNTNTSFNLFNLSLVPLSVLVGAD
mgnify:CR=1 FL=1